MWALLFGLEQFYLAGIAQAILALVTGLICVVRVQSKQGKVIGRYAAALNYPDPVVRKQSWFSARFDTQLFRRPQKSLVEHFAGEDDSIDVAVVFFGRRKLPVIRDGESGFGKTLPDMRVHVDQTDSEAIEAKQYGGTHNIARSDAAFCRWDDGIDTDHYLFFWEPAFDKGGG